MFCEPLRCEKINISWKGQFIWRWNLDRRNFFSKYICEQAGFNINQLQVFLFHFKNKAGKFTNKKKPESKRKFDSNSLVLWRSRHFPGWFYFLCPWCERKMPAKKKIKSGKNGFWLVRKWSWLWVSSWSHSSGFPFKSLFFHVLRSQAVMYPDLSLLLSNQAFSTYTCAFPSLLLLCIFWCRQLFRYAFIKSPRFPEKTSFFQLFRIEHSASFASILQTFAEQPTMC